MFKKLLIAALIAAPMCLQAQTLKIGAINPQEIFEVMPESATAKNTLQTAQDKYAAQAKPLQEEYEKKVKEFQALSDSKAADATLEAKIKEIQELETRIQNFQQTAQQDLQKQQETLMAPIQKKLQEAIQQVGAEGGYAAILYSDMLLYRGAQVEDLTAKVKAKLGIK
ncbi:MAG: OmpH family outer membrane protein [Muribaculaceae bacterium]|nr:OmpH family outer membrane protein [Muribaculaceae bacterium]